MHATRAGEHMLVLVMARGADDDDSRAQRICAVNSDASTPSKFSRHVVVRLPGMAFATHAMQAGECACVIAVGWC